MIITRIHEGQGLGNQLWCYTVCRSIADELKMPFMILGQENFKATEFLDVNFNSKKVDTSNQNQDFNLFHEQRFYDKEMDYTASCYDKRVENLSLNTEIEGLFQSERYFYGDLDRIKEYVQIKDEYRNLVNISSNTCTLNIRGGEYKRYKKFNLPKSYWVSAMNNMKNVYGVRRFQIVTDDHKYARTLFPNIEIIQEGVAESYIALHNSSYLIVSNSTFSYFPIKTKSVDPIVIAPKYFARFNDSCNKWASPANIYKKWLWQDRNGEMQTYEECINEANHVEAMYFSDYYIGVPPSLLRSKRVSALVPDRIKNVVKKSLSTLFPLKYG
jgi:hypothetical protein